jgi:uncharacterized cofD-like protein
MLPMKKSVKETNGKPNVLVIGGGTGTFTVLSGLKNCRLHISAIVTMMDSGGSTGRLRDQLGVLPPGDMRQALVALSESSELWRQLFTYRFEAGDLDGHTFGNIFLSALEKITGSTESAVSFATQILKTKGTIIPVTYTDSTLCARYADGSVVEGEALIDAAYTKRPRISYMYLVPTAAVNPQAIKAIEKADYIILGPGDLYTSIIPNLLVEGVAQAVKKSKAKKIYITNIMTKLGQTDGFKASNFVHELEIYMGGRVFDYILVNTAYPQKDIIDWYKSSENAIPVKDDLSARDFPGCQILRGNFLGTTKYAQSISDRIKRSLIRHDPAKLAKKLAKIFEVEAQ